MNGNSMVLRIATRGARRVFTFLVWIAVAFLFASIICAFGMYLRYVLWPLRLWIGGLVGLFVFAVFANYFLDRLREGSPMATINVDRGAICAEEDDRAA